jgi:tryptophanyl-tRNA synthetase
MIHETLGYIAGTDGANKMSKSYGNVINMFADEKALKKQVMGVVTDSTPVEEQKIPITILSSSYIRTLQLMLKKQGLRKNTAQADLATVMQKKHCLKKLWSILSLIAMSVISLNRTLTM